MASLNFNTFNQWYLSNPELVENLQTWLFYQYAIAEENFGQDIESKVEVADMTVFLLLFYLSSVNDYKYSYMTTMDELTNILETKPEVVKNALTSLSDHHLIHFHSHDEKLHITIEPVAVHE